MRTKSLKRVQADKRSFREFEEAVYQKINEGCPKDMPNVSRIQTKAVLAGISSVLTEKALEAYDAREETKIWQIHDVGKFHVNLTNCRNRPGEKGTILRPTLKFKLSNTIKLKLKEVL